MGSSVGGRVPALAAITLLLTVSCGGVAPPPDPAPVAAISADEGIPGPIDDAVTIRFGVFPNITHAPGPGGARRRWPAVQAAAQGDGPGLGVQLGHQRRRGTVRRRDRHHVHRPQPGHQRLLQGRGRLQGDLGLHLGRRLPRRSTRDRHGCRPQGQEDREPVARQHPGCRAPFVAQGSGAVHGRGRRRRRVGRPAGQLADARHLHRGHHRRRLGPRAVGDPADPGCGRQGAGRRAGPVAGRQVRHHAPARLPQVHGCEPGGRAADPARD